jgi:hypothetical protein
MKKYKIGDRIKVISEFIIEDKPHVGKVFTICRIEHITENPHYYVKEITGNFFFDNQIEKVNNTLRGLME